jgi:hypothetical protein
MTESKIEITERLRRTGQWPEASRFKDTAMRDFRAKGLPRAEATQAAWEAMAKAYPPPAEPEPEPDAEEETDAPDDDLFGWLGDAGGHEVDKWQREHNVTLTDEARIGLGALIGYCWMMGLLGYCPGPLYRQQVEATRWCVRPRPAEPSPVGS